MATRKPLVFISGRMKELPGADSFSVSWSWVGSTPTTLAGYGITDAAPIGSPAFTGIPTAPTAAPGVNTTQLATTAFVNAAVTAGGGALIIDSIADADTTHAPSRNAVFDALALKADDSGVVHTTGAETIAGQKTFTTQPTLFGNGISGSGSIKLQGAVGAASDVMYTEGLDNRWLWRKNNVADNDFLVYSYSDAGTATLRARWARATGVLDFKDAPTYDGAAILNAIDHPYSANNVASTLVQRNAAGDILTRLFRSDFGDQSTISGAFAYRINSTTDTYIRFCNSMPAVRAFLDAASLGTAETFNSLKTFAPGGGGYPSLSAGFHSLIVGDRGTADGLANILLNPLSVQGGVGLRYSESASQFAINDWGTAGAPARWVMHRTTGDVTMTGGLSLGTATAASVTDLSRHIGLYGTVYGLSITGGRQNYVVPSAATHKFVVAGADIATINNVGMQVNGSVTSDGIELGYRKVPLTTTNANYTYVADDAGKGRLHNNTTNYTYTIPAVFTAGDVLTVISSGSGILTLAGSGVNLYLSPGSSAAGNRTVGTRGIATVVFIASNAALVSGPGVT